MRTNFSFFGGRRAARAAFSVVLVLSGLFFRGKHAPVTRPPAPRSGTAV